MKTKYEWGKLVIKDRRTNKLPKESKSLKSVLEVSKIDSVIEAAEMVEYDFSGNGGEEKSKGEAKELDLVIPQKPEETLTREKYKEEERRLFSKWKGYMNTLLAQVGVLTPYERNLHVWRQLWFTLEKSDTVVQIVDARNPLLFYTEDIVKTAPSKKHFLLLNKSDLLTARQVEGWGEYFTQQGIPHMFYTASPASSPTCTSTTPNSSELLSKTEGVVGMVGYPNVGKSSTINSFAQRKVVQTSITPGKTKCVQTLEIFGRTVCDCPGLVFPSFVTEKQDLVLNGILSLDQTRDIKECIDTIIERVGLRTLCYLTGVQRLINDSRLSVRENYLAALKEASGCVEEGKLVKQVIKMYLEGKIRYVHAPPGRDAKEFNRDTHAVPEEYVINTEVSYSWYKEEQNASPKEDLRLLAASKKHYLKKGLRTEFNTNSRKVKHSSI
ncbi:large subunit GTPase 1 [Nematocida sp. AWRm77]|nr:large subunit GTPase 1 [Nematocida sp. AWRm77]